MLRGFLTLLCLAAAFAAALPATAQDGTSGLPVPRFVSLRADEVNLRTGPGVRYPIDWVYARQGLPVQVIAEFEAWRQIRDAEGTTGWVHRTMLSGRRTAATNGDVDRMFREPRAGAPVAAYVEAGVVGDLMECAGNWCRLAVASHGVEGWIERRGLWGVLPDETLN
jgi:SH3-like domain-containing protein